MDIPLGTLAQLKSVKFPTAEEVALANKQKASTAKKTEEPAKIKTKDNHNVALRTESKEKVKALVNNKRPSSIDVKSDSRPPKRKPVQIVDKREKRPPAPIKWRSRNINGDDNHSKHWAYKRNYMASYYQCDGENFPYEIWEISDKNKHKLVLSVDYCASNEGLIERLEECIRTLAKGFEITLNEHEEQHGKFFKENIKFVPYEEIEQPKLSAEEERIKNAQEEDRLMKLLAERRSKMNVQAL